MASTGYPSQRNPGFAVEHIERSDAPLLAIGLGGTGTDILRTVKELFAERFILPEDENGDLIPAPEKTAYLGIDTDHFSGDGFNQNEFLYIMHKGMDAILDPAYRDSALTPWERKWISGRLDSALTEGTVGLRRQIARFMLLRKHREVTSALTGALHRIVSVEADTPVSGNRIQIVIATGICGATGSGMFLDIAQIIRHIMKTDAILQKRIYRLTGYIIMPDISINRIRHSLVQINALMRNGFSALKELDFWMNVGEHQTPFRAELSDEVQFTWNRAPFDACILMSGTNVHGVTYSDADTVVCKTIAENLLQQYMQRSQASLEQNTTLIDYIGIEDYAYALANCVRATMPEQLPSYNGYHATGAYSLRTPRRKMMAYEATLILSRCIPRRDENQELLLISSLFDDGCTAERVNMLIDNPKMLYDSFITHVPLPDFCGLNPSNKKIGNAMRQMRPRPHDRVDLLPQGWRINTVKPSVRESADAHLDRAWSMFCDFAFSVITKPDQGPFSLKAYLESPDGLLMALQKKSKECEELVALFCKDVSVKYQDCSKNKWREFEQSPLLGRRKAGASYQQALTGYYNSVRRNEFFTAYANMVARLIVRIEEFGDKALSPLCDDLLMMERTLGGEGAAVGGLEGDLFCIDEVKDRIDAIWKQNNDGTRAITRFLEHVGDTVTATRPEKLPGSPDVVFTYRETALSGLFGIMEEVVDGVFGTLNQRSLDTVMLETIGADLQLQKNWADTLLQRLLDGAKPMFLQDAVFIAEPKAEYRYLFVPDNAPVLMNCLQNLPLASDVHILKSRRHDRIYCLTKWCGLPLYRYAMLRVLEDTYTKLLHRPISMLGLHLLADDDPDSDFSTDWFKLPSPYPENKRYWNEVSQV